MKESPKERAMVTLSADAAARAISIWLVEDDDSYRNTIANLINATDGMECIFTAATCEKAVEELDQAALPDIVLMDIKFETGRMDGVEATRRIKEDAPSVQVVILTNYPDDENILNAISAGATGFLVKATPAHEAIESLRVIRSGGSPITPQIARRILEMLPEKKKKPLYNYNLTKKEVQVLRHIVEGLTMKQIASNLFIATSTVDTHIRNIYEKLHVKNRIEAAIKALRENLT